jgi:hypothetical protein
MSSCRTALWDPAHEGGTLVAIETEEKSPNIQIHSSTEDDKAACDFSASVASAYRLSTRKTKILDQKYEIPGLYQLLEKPQKVMTRNQGFSMQKGNKVVTWNIRKMVQKRALERWETKLANCKVTPQAVWPIAKSVTKRGTPRHHLQFMVLWTPYFINVIKPI